MGGAITVEGLVIPVVSATEGFKVLGVQMSLVHNTQRELHLRIMAAWGKFHEIWPLRRRRDTSIRKRLQIFDSVVGGCMLWCCESWTLTRQLKQTVRKTQGAMLQRFACPRRRPEEEYIDWIRRATCQAELEASQARVRMWLQAALMQSGAGQVMWPV